MTRIFPDSPAKRRPTEPRFIPCLGEFTGGLAGSRQPGEKSLSGMVKLCWYFVVVAACGGVMLTGSACQSKVEALADSEGVLDGGGPKYASPWDRPIGMKGPLAGTESPRLGASVRNKTLQEMMQSTNPDALLASENGSELLASQFQVGDGVPQESDVSKAVAEKLRGSSRLDVTSGGAWTIVIAGFDGATERESAAGVLANVKRVAGLSQAQLEDRGRAVVVTYGSYPDPETAQAKRDLEKIRAVRVGESYPFANAMFAPPRFEAIGGTLPKFDLRNAKAMFGMGALYTLQMAVYCRLDDVEPTAKELGEFRTAAEKAVVELRRQGESAFYYHGPRRSSVTVGVFGDKDYNVLNPRQQSPVLAALRLKYPINVTNGAELKRKRTGQLQAVADPSFVVTLP